jgi:hypothetical protein
MVVGWVVSLVVKKVVLMGLLSVLQRVTLKAVQMVAKLVVAMVWKWVDTKAMWLVQRWVDTMDWRTAYCSVDYLEHPSDTPREYSKVD